MANKSIAGGAVVGALSATTVALTPAATVSVDASAGNVFTLVPAQAETLNAANVPATGNDGDKYTLVVTTSGVTSYVLTFGTGFKTTGTLTTGTTTAKVFVIDFVNVAGTLYEVARTAAM